MMVSLQTILDMILGIAPVPGLSLAFNTLKLIVSAVEQASTCKQRLAVLTQSVAQLLQTLNEEFTASRLVQSACSKPLNDLHSLLIDIEAFVCKEKARPFFKALLTQEERLDRIDGFHRRIDAVVAAFQISALLNIERMLVNARQTRRKDNEGVHTLQCTMEQNQAQLWRRTDVNHGAQPFIPSQTVLSNGITNMSGYTILNPGQARGANWVVCQPHLIHPFVWPNVGQPTVQSHIHIHNSCGVRHRTISFKYPLQFFFSLQTSGARPAHGANESSAQGAIANRALTRQRILLNHRRTNPYHGLSTWSPHPVTYNGKEYPTSEHLFQAFKFMDHHPDIAESIRTVSKSAKMVCEHSKTYKTQQHPDWDRTKVLKMEITLWHKFSQNPELKRLLLGTGDAELIHSTPGNFWGVGKGRNEYGKALERVRSGLWET
ncbi:hypothetical protein C8J57DRAFT_728497 [Mycena rebaudengoi]|nr:hypothetical protein C8J57DRAFT_728497 [Mycena rebaudengoi]